MELVLVSLGSNLGNSRQVIASACERLAAASRKPLRQSSCWLSTPVDCPPGSPKFINAAAALWLGPEHEPESFLRELQQLEREFGRQPKKILNEPRPLDLDLITYGSQTRDTEFLKLPHPRAHLRRFVLQPLSELAPSLVLPGQARSIAELLAGLVSDEILERAD